MTLAAKLRPVVACRAPDLLPADRVRVVQPWSKFNGSRGYVSAVKPTHVMVLIDGDGYPIGFGAEALEREDDP